jgi:signal transduction histidine kinase/CheY-like chemotaxis protein
MQKLSGWLFSSSGFMPHGHCFLWQPGTLWLNVASDGLIAAAYYAIPVALYYLVRERRTEIPYPGILMMFAAFILLCGSTHLMEIWTVWNPDYRLAGALKALTGIVSIMTMLALFQIIPQAMLLRGPKQLQNEVAARTAELARVNDELRAQIAARDLAESQLREQDQRKDEFLATLAHELRNPLAPIRHAVNLLSNDGASADQRRWGRDVIDRQSRRMALLLDDLLDVSRITRGRLQLKARRVRLREVIDSAIETVRPAIEDKAHELVVTQLDEAVDITVDPLRLSQSVSNLLTNAAKYTPPGGRICLSVALTPAALTISVSDTGIGFDPATAPALFQMFSQGGAGDKSADGGLGIGLALVKSLVQLHGGTAWAESRGTGFGAQFTIELPRSLVSADAAPTRHGSLTADGPAVARRARILIADDNRDAADSMGMLLELAGHDVDVAHSGNQALAIGRERHPDIVILDIGMPDMNGYDVARSLRDEEWGRHAFLLAMTGWGQASDKDKARAAGFDRHLTKPVDPKAIEELLSDVLLARTAAGAR